MRLLARALQRPRAGHWMLDPMGGVNGVYARDCDKLKETK